VKQEAESLPLVTATVPARAETDTGGLMWSGGAQEVVAAAQPGDSAAFTFQAATAGTYELLFAPTAGPGYGCWAIAVDGVALSAGNDFYAASDAIGSLDSAGTIKLAAGPHRLTLTATGRDAAATGAAIGLDYIALRPA
jgi:hypothetical protein